MVMPKLYIPENRNKNFTVCKWVAWCFCRHRWTIYGSWFTAGSYYPAFTDETEYNIGWWAIAVPFNSAPTPTSYPTDANVQNATAFDVNPALVIKDIIKNQSLRTANLFVNSLDTVQQKISTQPNHPTEASEIGVLSYKQEFVVSGTGESTGFKTSKLWYVRSTASMMSSKVPYDGVTETINNTVNLWINTIRDNQWNRYDPDKLGLSYAKTNKKLQSKTYGMEKF